MQDEIQVLIVEDDPYARDLMSILLARDWRTRVVGEFGRGDEAKIKHLLHQPAHPVDVMVVDTEVPSDKRWPLYVVQFSQEVGHPPAVLYTCTWPRTGIWEQVLRNGGGGYLVKSEILYGLASAVSLAASGYTVITPGIRDLAGAEGLPEQTVVLDGRPPVANFTHREKDVARLGLLFNLPQRDIADELVVSTDFVAETMSQLYEKLGVHELLSGETPLEQIFDDERLVARFRDILERSECYANGKAGRKAPWMPTIAFHLLTAPEIEK